MVGIEVLGPLQVDGVEIRLQRRDQVVLLALATQAGEELSTDGLAEALWSDAPPPTWPKVVQGSVLRLRRSLGSASIETTRGGYRLAVVGDELDSHRFEQLVHRGRALNIAGEYDRAAVAFARALDLWRGRPFDVLDSWPPGQLAAAQLEELRRTAEERLLEARLHLGEHRDVVRFAEALVAVEPLREHRWALLALAQYRSGMQGDALRTLKRARQTLVDQLGIEPSAELIALEAAILRQDEGLLAPATPPVISEQCPYKGLAPYDVDDTDAFFGRDGEVGTLRERLREHPLLVVTGPSGCGKSSLVRAGLVPALRQAGTDAVVFVPGSDPDAAMTNAVASSQGTPVVVVDQFEELFVDGAEIAAQAATFCARLAAYAMSRAPVVVAVRADRVELLASDPDFARLAERGLHLVTPLHGDSLREAIEGPATQAGLRLEQGLVDLLVRDCEGEPGALPLLSHALAETWQRRDGRVLTIEAYRATGEIRGAVARSADRLYESLPVEQRPKLRSVLLRLVAPTADGEPMRSRVPTRALGGDADRERLLGLLVRARLVTAEHDSVELAHEALARAWPRLRSWLDEDASGQRMLRHLSAAAEGWETLGRPDSELYRGARLETVLEWRAGNAPDLTAEEAAFLEASVAAAERERRAAAEQAESRTRQRRRQRLATVAVGILLAAAVGGGVLAYQQRQATRREQRSADVRALASTSEALRSSRPDVAALLAVEAHRMLPSAYTESALFGTFTGTPGLRRTRHTDIVLGVPTASAELVPGSDTLALADAFAGVHLGNLSTGEWEQLTPLSDSAGRSAMDVSADGRYAAVVWRSPRDTAPSMLAVWDLESAVQRFDPVEVANRGSSVAISSDGALVATAGRGDESPTILDGETGELIAAVAAPSDDEDPLSARAVVAFAPDGRLVVAAQNRPIVFVDPADGGEVERIDIEQRVAGSAVLFSEDGSRLVSVGAEGFVVVTIDSGTPNMSRLGGAFSCESPVLAPAIDALVCADAPRRVVAYEVDTGLPAEIPGGAGSDPVCALVGSRDGGLIEVSSCAEAATIREWRLDGGGAVSRLAYRSADAHAVQAYGFAGDGGSLIAWEGAPDADATLAIDVATGEVIDAFEDQYGLFPTDEPDIVFALFGDGSAGRYDVGQHAAVDRHEVGFLTDYMVSFGNRIAVAGGSADSFAPLHQVRILDFDTDEVLGPLIDGTGEFEVINFALERRGLLLAVELGDDGEQFQIERRDVVTGERIGEPAVGYRDFAIGGDVAVFVTTDGRILEVDPDSLQPTGLPFGDAGPDDWLMLDEQGRRLVVIGADETLRIYDVATRTQLGDSVALGDLQLEWAGAAIRSDGAELAVDGKHGIVVWDLDPAHWVEAACALAGRDLQQAEWDQYIGDIAPYRRTCSDARAA
jgi:DNA-binding SARP family transcriptional activator/WD40 repeat protein